MKTYEYHRKRLGLHLRWAAGVVVVAYWGHAGVWASTRPEGCTFVSPGAPPKVPMLHRGGIGSPLAAPFSAPLATGAAGGAERIIIKTPMVLAGHRVPFLRSLSPAQSATETAGRVGTSMSYRATNLDRGYSNVPRAATSSSTPRRERTLAQSARPALPGEWTGGGRLRCSPTLAGTRRIQDCSGVTTDDGTLVVVVLA